MSDAETPYPCNRFLVQVDGFEPFGVSEVRGLAVTVVPDDAPESTDHPPERERSRGRGLFGMRDFGDRIAASVEEAAEELQPRPTATPNLELRRAVTDDRTLWDWLQGWVTKRVAPRNVQVYLLDEANEPGRGWGFELAVPVAWTGPELVAGRDAPAMETLELAHDGISAIGP